MKKPKHIVKIIYFGDSITNGSAAKNKDGDVNGDYPAILSRLIIKHHYKFILSK
ncbi:MAG: hypothetical protein ABJN84_04385 [Flavobacteriaceae bacterium]